MKFGFAAVLLAVFVCGATVSYADAAKYLITEKGAGDFVLGKRLPASAEGYEIREETAYYEEGEEGPMFVLLKNGEKALEFEPERAEIRIFSAEYHTEEGIKVGDTLEDLVKAYPEYWLWYADGNETFVFNAKDRSKMQFQLDSESFIGKQDLTRSEPVQLSLKDFKPATKITSIRIWDTVQAAEYKTYLNARFGYSVEYPDIFDTGREPDNGDGIEFKGGEYGLTIWGGHNITEDDGNALLEACYDRVSHIVPDSERSGPGFYSIAYSDDGGQDGVEHIFHEYGVVNKDMKAAFVLKYPRDEEERFVEIKKLMETSLKLP